MSRAEALVEAVAVGDLEHMAPDGSYPVTEQGRLRAEALVYRHGISTAILAFRAGRGSQKIREHLKAVEARAEDARKWTVVNDG